MFLLILVVALGDIVGLVPMAALVAVMIMVSIATVDWHSVHPRTLRLMPLSETVVMVVTVVATVSTGNLAIGVSLGVITAMVLFARRVAHMTTVERTLTSDDTCTYRVTGELFWASSNDLVFQFDYVGDPENVVVDLTAATSGTRPPSRPSMRSSRSTRPRARRSPSSDWTARARTPPPVVRPTRRGELTAHPRSRPPLSRRNSTSDRFDVT